MKASRWILGVAAVPLVWLTLEQRVEQLEQQVRDMRQRLDAIEIGPGEVREWNRDQIDALWNATDELLRGAASPDALRKRLGFGERMTDLMRCVSRAAAAASEARSAIATNRPRRAAECAEIALRLYNAVAEAIDLPQRSR